MRERGVCGGSVVMVWVREWWGFSAEDVDAADYLAGKWLEWRSWNAKCRIGEASLGSVHGCGSGTPSGCIKIFDALRGYRRWLLNPRLRSFNPSGWKRRIWRPRL